MYKINAEVKDANPNISHIALLEGKVKITDAIMEQGGNIKIILEPTHTHTRSPLPTQILILRIRKEGI